MAKIIILWAVTMILLIASVIINIVILIKMKKGK